MDRLKVRFAGLLHLSVNVCFVPQERTARIRQGHARADCAQLSDAELAELVDWGCDHVRSFSARKEDLFGEIHAVWLGRVMRDTAQTKLAEDDAAWANYQASLKATSEVADAAMEAIPA